MKSFYSVLTICFLFLLTTCGGGIDKRGAVSRYKDGKVSTVGGGYYYIGRPNRDWRERQIKHRAVLFENLEDHSTITVSSWCKGAFDDAPLEILVDQQLMGLEDLKKLKSQKVKLEDREALQSEATGKADGAKVYIRSYVLKMNNCVFDFIYVSTPTVKSSVTEFENVVNGFQFGKGPKIL